VIRAWFLLAALSDVDFARQWYDTQRPGLGDDFISVVDAAIDDILDNPQAYPSIYRGTRRYLLARFPYCLYYRVQTEEVFIVACVHAARDPERHRKPLSD